MTVRRVNFRANCTSIEPTPPAAPVINRHLPSPVPSTTPSRSNNNSQAVIEVNGNAAASAALNE